MEEYTLTKDEAALQAQELIDKGKAIFFVKDTLLKRGANPEHVKEIILKLTEQKNKTAQRDKLLGIALLIVGILWIWAIFHFDTLHDFVMDRKGWKKVFIMFGPLGAGILYLIKGTFRLTKLF